MDAPNLDQPDFDQILDYGFAVRGQISDAAEDLDDPEKLLDCLREWLADDPVGLACALFANEVDHYEDDDPPPPRPKLAAFFWDYRERWELRSDPDLPR